ncbi:hypothetical protein Cpir12675_004102 [Ceratocystis pirilliformis]|uniref:Uncharacterized protein n=1 Tax=Ceratocystis pirilliformis TaxID=259994 RepID=A0ABR3Z1Q6_9PEZI
MATTTTKIRNALRATGLSGNELVRQTNLEVEKSKVTVDAVVSKGVEWIKLINIHEQWLFEMAANSRDFDSESGSESERVKITLGPTPHAKMLARASQSNPFHYRIPTVWIVPPRITVGEVKETDKVLDMADNAGPNIILETAKSDFVASMSLPLGIVLSRLMVDDHGYSKATTQQIIDEQKDPSPMTQALYSDLQGRDLARLNALFLGIYSLVLNPNPPERLAAFKALSSHVVPNDLRLPIKIVNFNIEQAFKTGLILETAGSVILELLDITCSTFIYGCISRTTTISCNKQLTSIVGRVVQQYNIGNGPIAWVCPVVRSLTSNGNHHRADKRCNLRKVREDKERLTQGEQS